MVGHSGAVTSLAYSASKRAIVSGSSDTTVMVWSPFVARSITTLRGHRAPIIGVRAAPDDGSYDVVSVDRDGVAKLWDARVWRDVYSWRVGESESRPVPDKYVPTTRQIGLRVGADKAAAAAAAGPGAAASASPAADAAGAGAASVMAATPTLSGTAAAGLAGSAAAVSSAAAVLRQRLAQYEEADAEGQGEGSEPGMDGVVGDGSAPLTSGSGTGGGAGMGVRMLAAGKARGGEDGGSGGGAEESSRVAVSFLDFALLPQSAAVGGGEEEDGAAGDSDGEGGAPGGRRRPPPESAYDRAIKEHQRNRRGQVAITPGIFPRGMAKVPGHPYEVAELSLPANASAGVTVEESKADEERPYEACGVIVRPPPQLFALPYLPGLSTAGASPAPAPSAAASRLGSAIDPSAGAAGGFTFSAAPRVSARSYAAAANRKAGLIGNLFVVSRALLVYRQVSDRTLEDKAAPTPVLASGYLPHDTSILTVTGVGFDVWCAVAGTKKRSFAHITAGTIRAAVLYAGGHRVLIGDSCGSLIAFDTSTGAPVAIFDGHSKAEIVAVCVDADGCTLSSTTADGVLLIHKDQEVDAYQRVAAAVAAEAQAALSEGSAEPHAGQLAAGGRRGSVNSLAGATAASARPVSRGGAVSALTQLRTNAAAARAAAQFDSEGLGGSGATRAHNASATGSSGGLVRRCGALLRTGPGEPSSGVASLAVVAAALASSLEQQLQATATSSSGHHASLSSGLLASPASTPSLRGLLSPSAQTMQLGGQWSAGSPTGASSISDPHATAPGSKPQRGPGGAGFARGRTCEVICIASSRAHRVVLCAGSDRRVCAFDIDTGKVECVWKTAGDVACLLVVQDQPLVCSGDNTGTVSVWSLRTGGRSYGLLAAFRNQPLAFAALYTAAGMGIGRVAGLEALLPGGDAGEAGSRRGSAGSGGSGPKADARASTALAAQPAARPGTASSTGSAGRVPSLALPQARPTGRLQRGAAARASERGSVSSSASDSDSDGVGEAVGLRSTDRGAIVAPSRSLGVGAGGGAGGQLLGLGVRGAAGHIVKRHLSVRVDSPAGATTAALPAAPGASALARAVERAFHQQAAHLKPAGLVRLVYHAHNRCLYAADEAGVTSAWDLSRVLEYSRRSARAAMRAAMGASAASPSRPPSAASVAPSVVAPSPGAFAATSRPPETAANRDLALALAAPTPKLGGAGAAFWRATSQALHMSVSSGADANPRAGAAVGAGGRRGSDGGHMLNAARASVAAAFGVVPDAAVTVAGGRSLHGIRPVISLWLPAGVRSVQAAVAALNLPAQGWSVPLAPALAAAAPSAVMARSGSTVAALAASHTRALQPVETPSGTKGRSLRGRYGGSGSSPSRVRSNSGDDAASPVRLGRSVSFALSSPGPVHPITPGGSRPRLGSSTASASELMSPAGSRTHGLSGGGSGAAGASSAIATRSKYEALASARRNSDLYGTGLNDPSLAVLPVLADGVGGTHSPGDGAGKAGSKTPGGGGAPVLAADTSNTCSGPEMVRFLWSSRHHGDAVSALALIPLIPPPASLPDHLSPRAAGGHRAPSPAGFPRSSGVNPAAASKAVAAMKSGANTAAAVGSRPASGTDSSAAGAFVGFASPREAPARSGGELRSLLQSKVRMVARASTVFRFGGAPVAAAAAAGGSEESGSGAAHVAASSSASSSSHTDSLHQATARSTHSYATAASAAGPARLTLVYLLSASFDKTACVLDITDGAVLGRLANAAAATSYSAPPASASFGDAAAALDRVGFYASFDEGRYSRSALGLQEADGAGGRRRRGSLAESLPSGRSPAEVLGLHSARRRSTLVANDAAAARATAAAAAAAASGGGAGADGVSASSGGDSSRSQSTAASAGLTSRSRRASQQESPPPTHHHQQAASASGAGSGGDITSRSKRSSGSGHGFAAGASGPPGAAAAPRSHSRKTSGGADSLSLRDLSSKRTLGGDAGVLGTPQAAHTRTGSVGGRAASPGISRRPPAGGQQQKGGGPVAALVAAAEEASRAAASVRTLSLGRLWTSVPLLLLDMRVITVKSLVAVCQELPGIGARRTAEQRSRQALAAEQEKQQTLERVLQRLGLDDAVDHALSDALADVDAGALLRRGSAYNPRASLARSVLVDVAAGIAHPAAENTRRTRRRVSISGDAAGAEAEAAAEEVQLPPEMRQPPYRRASQVSLASGAHVVGEASVLHPSMSAAIGTTSDLLAGMSDIWASHDDAFGVDDTSRPTLAAESSFDFSAPTAAHELEPSLGIGATASLVNPAAAHRAARALAVLLATDEEPSGVDMLSLQGSVPRAAMSALQRSGQRGTAAASRSGRTAEGAGSVGLGTSLSQRSAGALGVGATASERLAATSAAFKAAERLFHMKGGMTWDAAAGPSHRTSGHTASGAETGLAAGGSRTGAAAKPSFAGVGPSQSTSGLLLAGERPGPSGPSIRTLASSASGAALRSGAALSVGVASPALLTASAALRETLGRGHASMLSPTPASSVREDDARAGLGALRRPGSPGFRGASAAGGGRLSPSRASTRSRPDAAGEAADILRHLFTRTPTVPSRKQMTKLTGTSPQRGSGGAAVGAMRQTGL